MKKILFFLFLLVYTVSNPLFADKTNGPPITDRQERMQRIFARGTIANQGADYMNAFMFDAALEKFRESTLPQYLNDVKDESDGLWRMARLYLKLGNYDEVARIYKWHDDHGMGGEWIKEERANLHARVAWQKTRNKKPVYDFIEEYKRNHKAFIPPKRSGASEMATVAELYDLISDYDAGIAWAKMFWKADKSEPRKKTNKEYTTLIQAFEESKRGMPKVCSDDGKYCVGRATAYIIRSTYF